ncbi:hypothetical protein D3C71_2247260 [compost metagenome]
MGSKGAAIWSAMMNRIFGRVMVASIVEGYAMCLAYQDATVDNMGKAHGGQ